MDWKKVPYYIPGVGLVAHTIREYKSRKGKKPIYNIRDKRDMKALGNYLIQTAYLTFAISSKAIVVGYVHQGISTGDWNPFKYFKENTMEKKQEVKKENNLEKTITYEEILK